MASEPPPSIGLGQLLISEKYSDLKLVCEGKEFKAHKVVVCTQSPVLAAAIDGVFLEATTNTINIEEFDVATVERMVAFFYEQEYNADEDVKDEEMVTGLEKPEVGENSQAQSDDEESSRPLTSTTLLSPYHVTKAVTVNQIIVRHVMVNAIADYYDIFLLKQLANAKILSIIDTNWSANGFLDVVKAAFAKTSDTALHNILISTASLHIEELLQIDAFAEAEKLSGFAIGIIRQTTAAHRVKEESSTQELQKLQDRFRGLKQICELWKSDTAAESARKDRVIQNIDASIQALKDHRKCRNTSCGVIFTCTIEKDGYLEPSYTLRCTRCRCKHYRR